MAFTGSRIIAFSRLFDRDRLYNADRKAVAGTCVDLFERVQYRPAENQLLGLATSFILLADALRVPAQDAFTAAKNLMADTLNPSGLHRTFDAMAFHLKSHVLAGNGGNG